MRGMLKRVKCTTRKELGKAIKNGANYIEIYGDLKNQTVHIMVTGKAAWGVCIGALGAAIVFYLETPAATVATTPAGGAATSVAATVLGAAATTAVTIGVAAGGVGALNTLRNKYTIIEKNEEYIVLRKK